MKTLKIKITTEKVRAEEILKELGRIIELIQYGDQDPSLVFIENSVFLKSNNLVSEDGSEEELHQEYEYYEGYRNGLNFALLQLSASKIGA